VRTGMAVGWLSIGLNLLLFVLKLWAGLSTGSVAMFAEAWHTLSDSLTSLIALLGFRFGARPADQGHPFGHGRAEAIAALIIGVLLGVVGVGFGYESIVRLLDQQGANWGPMAIAVFLVSALLKEGLARYSIRVGRRLQAPALVADGWHHRSDAVASAVIVLGALVGPGLWWMDGALGLVVAALILHAAWDIIRDASNTLMGGAPSAEIERRIREVVAAHAPPGAEPHHLHLHSYGTHAELTLHLYLDPEMTVRQAHAIADQVEVALKAELGFEATIHVDPMAERQV